MAAAWRTSHSALFVLHIERRPWETDGPLAPPDPYLSWHTYFAKALECPSILANFLIQDLAQDIPLADPYDILGSLQLEENSARYENPIASMAMWLVGSQALTDLVDITGYQQLPGSPVSSQFDAYAASHPSGALAADMAVGWMQGMSDNALHVDGQDSALQGLRNESPN
jgi:hypothetical protein